MVLRSDRLLEAPNWHPDDYLIVNEGGGAFRLPLGDGQDDAALEAIDTRGLHQLDNDHGLSPDGRALAISERGELDQSLIYTFVTSCAALLPCSDCPCRSDHCRGRSAVEPSLRTRRLDHPARPIGHGRIACQRRRPDHGDYCSNRQHGSRRER